MAQVSGMLRWYETPEVIRDFFNNSQDEDVKRLGVHLIDEVVRLRGMLRTLEVDNLYETYDIKER